MASLFVIKGLDQGKRYELNSPVLSMGRDLSNPIRLNDTEVSRRHAEIRRFDDNHGFEVVDLDSSNGTFVNSQKIGEHELKSGDRVQIGRTLLIFTGDDSEYEAISDVVDIVDSRVDDGESRIVKSMSGPSGDQMFGDATRGESPWLARARSNLQIMYRTALAVSHTLDIDQLLRRIMDLIFEWVEADRGVIMLINQESGQLIPKVRHNRPGIRTDDRMVISQTILDYVLENQEGVLTSDARADDRFEAAGSIVKMGVREAIGVPLQGRYGTVGIIYIDTFTSPGRALKENKAEQFTEEHLKLMIAIGHQAALAVEDTSYYSAMVQAERMAAIGQTITGLSHHVKNILQGIRGGSYLIEEGLKEDNNDVVRKGWGIVDRNQEKISRLVLDMLTFSKEREPELQIANLNKTAREVVELMTQRASDLGIELVFEPDEALPSTSFDPELVHHAVLNVVTNALDACESNDSGRVVVSTALRSDSNRVEVRVSDNGNGISPENLERIFSIFESDKGARGTGLGLSVSQKIMQEHGGDIRVTSNEGAGSEFTLELPAISQTSA